jgi:pimeloyl-ACP methyl ester carboxylesterase
MLTLLAAFGCTSITQIRTVEPAAGGAGHADILPPPTTNTAAFLDCRTGSPAKGENLRIIEDYGNYVIGYAEFDDQGWAYQHDAQLAVINDRLKAELSNPDNAATDFLVLVFVHGWHHNAHDNDCNVQEFRQMVRLAAEGTEAAIQQHKLVKHRRVLGVYVGWRGEIITAAGLRYLTPVDRHNAAERVAKGSVRKLFANLHEQQILAQRGRIDRMRTIVIGHSFGGLVAFSALAQGELNDLTLATSESPLYCDPRDPRHAALTASPVWPDALILINPAFEASRFEEFDRLVKGLTPCVPPAVKSDTLVVPNFMVITAENDIWTGKMFTVGRSVGTLFEGYDRTDADATQKERLSNLHAIGFVPSYQTHRLDLNRETPPRAVATLLPAAGSPLTAQSPVWVVRASAAVVNGHTGFLYARPNDKDPSPYLADWLLDIYDMDCGAAPGMVNCAAAR